MTREELEAHYAEAAEWNMATMEMMLQVKKTAKHEKERQRNICLKMLDVCSNLSEKALNSSDYRRASRVISILASAKAPGREFSTNRGRRTAFNEWAEGIKP